ncbi:RIO kinase 2 [Pancytospora philotis]|nr:RIO kinase 2 [Pancytospora philotis]
MKLESDSVWTVTKSHLKILEAAERMSKTHEYVPIAMLRSRAGAVGNFHELAMDLTTHSFLTYRDKMYKLSISGLDCLAINGLRARGMRAMGSNIGIGKESDIYYGVFEGKKAAIKIHRLGRTSYQKVDERNLKGCASWFDKNKENCRREYEFLQLFSEMDVPRVFCYDRHAIVMELLDYDTLYQVHVEDPAAVAANMIRFIRRLWDAGYVHGDFNEFNVMVSGSDIKVVDFPQCVPASDEKAAEYLKRDVECVHKYFWKKYFHVCDDSILHGVYEQLKISIDVERKEIDIGREPRALPE